MSYVDPSCLRPLVMEAHTFGRGLVTGGSVV